jgi:hypothetical protein
MRRNACIFLAAATGVLAIVACGSSGKARSPSSAAGVSSAIKYAACVRAHGVPNFPDPGSGGGLQIPNDINPASPAFQTAQRACQSLMPGGPGGPGAATAQQKQTMLQLARCMRVHGVPDFPDPVSSPPANPAGLALAFGRPGAFIVIPDTLNPQSPKFKQAAKACRLPGT